jgi:dolichol-phosphate mannosyltransferase
MIYILFPVYNEQTNLRRLIRGVFREFSSEDIRIIVVNDGSDDNSLEILQQELRPSDVIRTKLINMNVGAAFSEGIQVFLSMGNENDLLVIMETDLTSDIASLKVLVKNIRVHDQDVVIASRYLSGGCYRNFPIFRRILSYSVNRLLGVLFPIKNVFDYSIFYRAYSWRILARMQEYFGTHGIIQSKGFSANAELLVKASYLNAKIAEIPFIYDYAKKDGKSKILILHSVLEYFRLIVYLKTVSKKIFVKALIKKTRNIDK